MTTNFPIDFCFFLSELGNYFHHRTLNSLFSGFTTQGGKKFYFQIKKKKKNLCRNDRNLYALPREWGSLLSLHPPPMAALISTAPELEQANFSVYSRCQGDLITGNSVSSSCCFCVGIRTQQPPRTHVRYSIRNFLEARK